MKDPSSKIEEVPEGQRSMIAQKDLIIKKNNIRLMFSYPPEIVAKH